MRQENEDVLETHIESMETISKLYFARGLLPCNMLLVNINFKRNHRHRYINIYIDVNIDTDTHLCYREKREN